MNATRTTPLEPGNRIRLPAEWADALGLHGLVVLDKTSEGILVRPGPPVTWDEIFATRLTIGHPALEAPECEVTKDDLLF